jgi:hypothetical protein
LNFNSFFITNRNTYTQLQDDVKEEAKIVVAKRHGCFMARLAFWEIRHGSNASHDK